VLGVSDPAGGRMFGADDAHLLIELSARVARAWEDSRILEHSERRVADTTHALHRVLEHLEQAGRRAPDRVRLAREVARALDLDDRQTAMIAYAASIHDLGMSRVDEGVREGSAPLTPEHRAELARHPEAGADLLGPLERVGAVRDIVLCHHEWWDGTGYPRGLASVHVPVGARILAVVDAWESMIVGRRHRPALGVETAMAELRRRRGVQFDPAVVDAFEGVWRSIEREQPVSAPVPGAHAVPHGRR